MKYIFPILLGLLSIGLSAQHHEVGVSAGLHLGSFNYKMNPSFKNIAYAIKEKGDLPYNLTAKIQLQGNINYQFHFTNKWAIQTKIGYLESKIYHEVTHEYTNNLGEISSYTHKNSYKLQYFMGNIGGIYYIKSRLYVSLGAYLSYLHPSSYHQYTLYSYDRLLTREFDNLHRWEKIDFGGSAEIGYRFGKLKQWQINMSALVGANAISPFIYPLDDYRFYNMAGQLSVGYWFGFKKKD